MLMPKLGWPNGLAPKQWSALLALLITLFTLWWLYPGTLSSLVLRWGQLDESYSHGWIVVAVCLFMALRASSRLALGRPNLWALPVLGVMILLWLVSDAVDIIIVQQLLLPMMFWTTLWFVGGWSYAKGLLFVVGFSYFAIPIWDYLIPALVQLTVVVVAQWVALIDIPLLIEGHRITIPSGQFVVADGCSGIRYFVVSLAFSVLYGAIYKLPTSQRIWIVVIGALVGLAANWIRVYALILIGSATQMQSSLMQDHEYFGLGVFAACLFLYSWGLGRLLPVQTSPEATANLEQAPQAVESDNHDASGQSESSDEQTTPSPFPWLSGAALLLVMVGSFALVHHGGGRLYQSQPSERFERSSALTQVDWQHQLLAEPQRAAHQQIFQLVSQPPAYVLVAHYHLQQPKQDFLPYRTWFNETQWMSLQQGQIDLGRDVTGSYRKLEQRDSGEQWNLLYWFEVGSYLGRNRFEAKLLELLALLKGRQDARLLMVAQRCTNHCSEELKTLIEALGQHPELGPQHVIRGVRE